MMSVIKTAITHPDHQVVGHIYKAYNQNIYFCDSYDPAIGFWMTNVDDPTDRTNVSERAIDRTFHHQYKLCKHVNCQMPKAA